MKVLQNSQENTTTVVSFLIKLQRETSAQLFCCEFFKIFYRTLFTEHLRTQMTIFLVLLNN